MKEVKRFKGKVIMSGYAKAPALVCKENLSFYDNIDDDTGDVVDVNCPLYGENVTGKVLVYPTGKSSTTNCWIMYTMGKRGNAPAAIINTKLDTIQVTGAICGNIPMIHVTECDPIDLIESGDTVEVNGDTGEVIVTKKKD